MARDEKLNPQHANIIECIQHLGSQQDSIHPLRAGQFCRHGGAVQDAVAVDIFTGVITGDIARRTARGDNGHLVGEIDKPLKHRRSTVHIGESLIGIIASAQPRLPLAVITEAAGFQDAGGPDGRDGSGHRSGVRYIGKGGDRQAQPLQKFLFGQPVLRNA